MAELIDEACPSCHRKSVEVEFKYQHPWRLGIVWGLILLALLGLGKLMMTVIPLSHEGRLMLTCVSGGVVANVLRGILEPRIAKRTAYLRCRLCGESTSRLAIKGLETAAKP